MNCKSCSIKLKLSPGRLKTSSGYCKTCRLINFNTKPFIELSEKQCTSCERILSISNFKPAKTHRHYNKRCTQCRNLENVFKINYKEYIKLLIKQNNVCAICQMPEFAKHQNGNIRSLAVDHDHITNQVRGLLCTRCNTGLGNFKDNVILLENSIKYLKGKNIYERK